MTDEEFSEALAVAWALTTDKQWTDRCRELLDLTGKSHTTPQARCMARCPACEGRGQRTWTHEHEVQLREIYKCQLCDGLGAIAGFKPL